MTSPLTTFIRRRWRVPDSALGVEVQVLGGGLESAVARVRITGSREAGIPRELVVKQLSGDFAREADVYDALWQHLVRPPAVRVFGRDVSGGDTHLYLEHAMPLSSWPWSDAAHAPRVCRELARLHDSPDLPRERFFWNYEDQLSRSAEDTLAVALVARDGAGRRLWRRLGDLRRVVGALPRIRRRLLSGGETVIHGDMHPGNVIVRQTNGELDVVLLDWARARVGSPLEDIASWLHSLGCWEPDARRRHDTLMRAYLEARRVPRIFDADMRIDYWLASVSNGLAGAIRYHLAVTADAGAAEPARLNSARALLAWQRVVRRAAAVVNTSLDR